MCRLIYFFSIFALVGCIISNPRYTPPDGDSGPDSDMDSGPDGDTDSGPDGDTDSGPDGDMDYEMDTVIGVATDLFDLGNRTERLQEVPIGNLVADSMRLSYGTDLAFANGGAIRAPIPSSYAPEDTTLRRTAPGYAAGPPYDIVAADVYAVLPHDNLVVIRTVTGEQLWAMLEQGISALPNPFGGFPQISGFRFIYDAEAPSRPRVTSVSLADSTAIRQDTTEYTIAISSFLNNGGDGYSMLDDGTGVEHDIMADVLLYYIVAEGTITPMTDGRITAE